MLEVLYLLSMNARSHRPNNHGTTVTVSNSPKSKVEKAKMLTLNIKLFRDASVELRIQSGSVIPSCVRLFELFRVLVLEITEPFFPEIGHIQTLLKSKLWRPRKD